MVTATAAPTTFAESSAAAPTVRFLRRVSRAPAGTDKTFYGKSVTVRAGNAAGVDIVVNGKDAGNLGAAGDVVERTFSLTGK